jgi:hypothetical protein
MSKSIYGSAKSGMAGFTPPIYGYGRPLSCDCDCQPTVDPRIALQNLLNILHGLLMSLKQHKVGESVNAPLVTKMGVKGIMSFALYSRIVWAKLHPDKLFNKTSTTDINSLKDIYLSYNQDWRADKMLVKLSQTAG